MAGIVNDPFSDSQTNNTTLTSGAWTPTNSSRILASTPPTDTQMIDVSPFPGWTFSPSDASSVCALAYVYNTPQNFTSMSTITIPIFAVNAGTFSLTMQLTDSGSVSSPEVLGAYSGLVGTPVTWTINGINFPTVNLTLVSQMVLRARGSASSGFVGAANALTSAIACMPKDTMILMANGKETPIQNIVRGDLIAGNLECNITHKVAYIMHSELSAIVPIDIVKITKGTLGQNKPNKDLFLSGWHPILWNQKRRPAKCFQKFMGVTWWNNTITAGEILPVDTNEQKTYSLYNLQFDHDGLFVANGVIVQAVSPYSNLFPLNKELFFDSTLYKDDLTWESYIEETPWDDSMISDIPV